MDTQQHSWGPMARGVYLAMLWLALLIAWRFPQVLTQYLALLLFLGLALKPILVWSGLAGLLDGFFVRVGEARWKKVVEQRRRLVSMRERDKQYRQERARDPRLPPNW